MAQLDFYIYKYHFLKTKELSLPFEEEGADGDSNIAMAEKCFESLFDERNIPNLVKTKKKGESTRLLNTVLKKDNDILLWQVNNSIMKKIWMEDGKDGEGKNKFAEKDLESVPPCYVMIDNRPDSCLIAIEKNGAWSKTDKLRDVILETFNNILRASYGLEMRIPALISPTEFWDFVHQKIREGDYLKKLTLNFNDPEDKSLYTSESEIIRMWFNFQQRLNADKSRLELTYGKNSISDIDMISRDLNEFVNVCLKQRYDLIATFKKFGDYNPKKAAKAKFPLNDKDILSFLAGPNRLSGKTVLEYWFDDVKDNIKDCYDEEDTQPKRNRKNKRSVQR